MKDAVERRLVENLILAGGSLLIMYWSIWTFEWPPIRYALAAWVAVMLALGAHGVWLFRTCMRAGGISRLFAFVPIVTLALHVTPFIQTLRLMRAAAELRDELRHLLW